jgi:5'-nucleotidase
MARAMVDAPGWFGSLPVTPGATDGVARLLDAGVDVWVCTKPLEVNPTCHHDKFHWLNRHFPALAERLVICPDKSLMRGAVLLDDAPKPHWFKVALWEPVIFPAPFNASQFDGVRRWSWSDPVADLFGAVS